MSPSLLNIKHYRHISSPNRVEAGSKKQHWNVSFIQDVDTIKTRNFLGTPEHKTDSIFWHHIWHHIHINTKFPVDIFSFHKLGGKTSFCTLVIFVCSFSETFRWPQNPTDLLLERASSGTTMVQNYLHPKKKSCFVSLRACAQVFLPPPFPFFCLGEGQPSRKHFSCFI